MNATTKSGITIQKSYLLVVESGRYIDNMINEYSAAYRTNEGFKDGYSAFYLFKGDFEDIEYCIDGDNY